MRRVLSGSVLKHLVLGSIIAASAGACSGGGCTSSCGGLEPLRDGFTLDNRIENAGAVRITDSGFRFIEANLGTIASGLLDAEGGVLTFPIDTSSGTIEIPVLPDADYTICPNGPTNAPLTCTVEVEVGALNLDFAPNGPHHITASGGLPIRLQDLPIETSIGDGNITISGNRVCPGEGPTFANIPVSVRISLEVETDQARARYGYSKVRIEDVSIDTDSVTDQIALCGGVIIDILDFDFIRGFVVDQVAPGLIDTLKGTLEEQLCQSPSAEVPCPSGTNDIDGVCRYGTDGDSDCVSMVLGLDGHADLGGLLASISPGTEGGLDFLLAAGGPSPREDGTGLFGDLDPIGGGATIGMFGGVEPRPVSGCVPLSTLALPAGIPIPDELRSNTVPGWPATFPRPDSTGPDLGISVSEEFFNYSLAGMYNSGLLCIGITTETVGDLLNTGTVGLFAASLRDLTLQRENAPIAIVLRPTNPPHVEFGNGTNLETDPNMLITLDQVAFDFYVWSLDRFLRVFTAKFDLEVPANLEVTPEGLQPVITDVGVNNPSVENAELLAEDPSSIAEALASLLSGQVGSLLAGGISPIDLGSALGDYGLALRIPDTVEGQGSAGIRKLTKGTHDYLGIFAGLETAPIPEASVTTAFVVSRLVDPAGMQAATMRLAKQGAASNAPVVTIEASNDAPGPVEFQWKVDKGPWRPFTRTSSSGTPAPGDEALADNVAQLRIQDEAFRLEGVHTVQVRGREIGEPWSLSEPEHVAVRIDIAAPQIFVEQDGDDFTVDAFDVVTDREDLEVRVAFDDQPASVWMAIDALPDALAAAPAQAEQVTISVRDEEGNINAETQPIGEARQSIIRGAPRADSDGCGCSLPGTENTGRGTAALIALGLGAMVLARRSRKERRTSGAAAPSVAPAADAPAVATRRTLRSRTASSSSLGGILLGSRAAQIFAAMVTIGVGASFSGCSCGDDPNDGISSSSSGAGGNGGGGGEGPSCTGCTVVEPGLIGAYTSAAVDEDGNIWVAGYAEANWTQGYQHGDLVVGQWDGDKVEWEAIDGVPEDPEVDGSKFDTSSFRGGQIEPGEDVGLWSSIAIDDDGNPAVAYFDRTNKQLKYASMDDGDWVIDVVDQVDDGIVGRYAKLWFEDGEANIAYQSVSPADSGFLTSKVRIAKGGSSGGFQFDEVAIDAETPCSGELCTNDSYCVAETRQCVPEATGCAECGDGEECVAGATPTCAEVISKNALETYPNAIGNYVTVAQDPGGGVGLAWYDRVRGTLVAARKSGPGWVTSIVDGGGEEVSDVGIGATLAITSDNEWHLAYVDGYDEALKYARLGSDGSVASIEVVDDGIGLTGAPFPDGKHIVGDDPSIYVASNGDVRISYQDATAGKLRVAVGTESGVEHTWTREILEGKGVGGAFSKLLDTDDGLRVVHWWREGGEEPVGDVDIVTP
jgi:hypothetical protein